VALSVSHLGPAAVETTVVMRGRFATDRLRDLVDGSATTVAAAATAVNEVDYHGATILESSTAAVACVTPTVIALGSRAAVRRVLDVAHQEDEGVRNAAGDRRLLAALARAPTAKLGRPAIMAALLPSESVRERLRAESWQVAAELEWVAFSFAVGDGFDVGIVAGARGAEEASRLADAAKARAAALRQQPTVRLLGLVPFIEPFIAVAKNDEVHVAYRLAERRVDDLVTRLEQMSRPRRAMRDPPRDSPHNSPQNSEKRP
jgi:hypothetical protein